MTSKPQQLPLHQPWYRELLVVAAAVGAIVGVLGLVYRDHRVASDLIFGEPQTQALSGQWWWVGGHGRRWAWGGHPAERWAVPEHVPGGVAVIESGKVYY